MREAGVEGVVRQIHGDLQTDFMVNTIDKGTGIRHLASMLGHAPGGGEGKLLALAAADSSEDLPLLRRARVPMAPARSELAASRPDGVRVLGQGGPRSVGAAAATLLGHEPGTCEQCRPPHLAPRSRLLLALLATQDMHGPSAFGHVARLAIAMRRSAP
jgi:hypothetical protein